VSFDCHVALLQVLTTLWIAFLFFSPLYFTLLVLVDWMVGWFVGYLLVLLLRRFSQTALRFDQASFNECVCTVVPIVLLIRFIFRSIRRLFISAPFHFIRCVGKPIAIIIVVVMNMS